MSMACVGDLQEVPKRNEWSVWLDDAMGDREDN